MKEPARDGSFSLGDGHTTRRFGDSLLVFTSAGVVVAHRYPDVTILEAAHAGRYFHRSWRESFSERFTITLAKRFAADITAPQQEPRQ